MLITVNIAKLLPWITSLLNINTMGCLHVHVPLEDKFSNQKCITVGMFNSPCFILQFSRSFPAILQILLSFMSRATRNILFFNHFFKASFPDTCKKGVLGQKPVLVRTWWCPYLFTIAIPYGHLAFKTYLELWRHATFSAIRLPVQPYTFIHH